MIKRHPFPGNGLRKVIHWTDSQTEPGEIDRESIEDIEKANVVTSEYGVDLHRPVIDIDLPVAVLSSSTPGHCHLFIDVPLTDEEYFKLLDVMVEVGIVQPGYVNASKQRGYTAVRLPWIRKQSELDD